MLAPSFGGRGPTMRIAFGTFLPRYFSFGLQLRAQNLTPFQAFTIHPKTPKKHPKPSPDHPKMAPKQHLILQCPKFEEKKTQPSHTKPSFLKFPSPWKLSQNQYPNAFRISFILDTLLESPKVRLLMLKRRQDGSPSFLNFMKIVEDLLYCYYGLWSKMPFRSLEEPPKSLPRGAKRPSRSTQAPPRSSYVANSETQASKQASNDWY